VVADLKLLGIAVKLVLLDELQNPYIPISKFLDVV
jgi:hypothetical protein